MSAATEAKDFAFTEENLIRAKQLIGRYPEGRQASEARARREWIEKSESPVRRGVLGRGAT